MVYFNPYIIFSYCLLWHTMECIRKCLEKHTRMYNAIKEMLWCGKVPQFWFVCRDQKQIGEKEEKNAVNGNKYLWQWA